MLLLLFLPFLLQTLMNNYVAITSKTFLVSILIECVGVLVSQIAQPALRHA
jgi:hypothetical protein